MQIEHIARSNVEKICYLNWYCVGLIFSTGFQFKVFRRAKYAKQWKIVKNIRKKNEKEIIGLVDFVEWIFKIQL